MITMYGIKNCDTIKKARRWLEANPDDDFAAEVRAELNIAPKRYVTYARECFGWGVFALIAR